MKQKHYFPMNILDLIYKINLPLPILIFQYFNPAGFPPILQMAWIDKRLLATKPRLLRQADMVIEGLPGFFLCSAGALLPHIRFITKNIIAPMPDMLIKPITGY
jgi:hypothetical protein